MAAHGVSSVLSSSAEAFVMPQRFQMWAVVLTEVMLASLKNTMQL